MPFRTKYLHWHRRQFSESNAYVRACPKPGCDYYIELSPFYNGETVLCKCGEHFCILCGKEHHEPCNCEQVLMWLNKEKDDNENDLWLKANTKQCPKCKMPIEKNQGCIRMECKHASCGYQFCWNCLGDWGSNGYNSHGMNACQKLDKEKKNLNNSALQQQINDQEYAKFELERYKFSYDRYRNHDKSRNICIKFIPKLMENLDRFHIEKNYPARELQFMEEAAQSIIKSRQTLKWAFVALYVLDKPGGTRKDLELFKYQLEWLERECERTHGFLETDLTPFLDPF